MADLGALAEDAQGRVDDLFLGAAHQLADRRVDPLDSGANDFDNAVHPGGVEVCNAIDDDCNGLTDEDQSGEDSDGDLVGNLCDNCVSVPNGDQINTDSARRCMRC